MPKNKKLTVKVLWKNNYLSMIRKACGSDMWANGYALINGRKKDVIQNGSVACAFFICSILKIFDLIKEMHMTVQGAEKDLKECGWQRIPISSRMPIGSVLIWEKKSSSGKKQTAHAHIGFYMGDERAISIWVYDKCPVIHHWTYNKTRKIVRAYKLPAKQLCVCQTLKKL